MYIDKSIHTVEMPQEVVEHLKEVEKYLKETFSGGCWVGIDGMVTCTFRI